MRSTTQHRRCRLIMDFVSISNWDCFHTQDLNSWASFMLHFTSLLKINRQINQMCYTFFICRSKEIRSPRKIFTSPHIDSSIVGWFLKMLFDVSVYSKCYYMLQCSRSVTPTFYWKNSIFEYFLLLAWSKFSSLSSNLCYCKI